MGTIGDLLNSNFTTSLLGAGAGAWAGAYAAQRIAERAKLRDVYLNDIKYSNTAAAVAFQICNMVLALKSQYVSDLLTDYRKCLGAFEAELTVAREGERAPSFALKVDFETIDPLVLPVERLQLLAFEKLSLGARPLAAVTTLIHSVHALNRTITERNELITEIRRTGPHAPPVLAALYFGLKDNSGNTDRRYRAAVEAIASQTDDCIFFSRYAGEELVLHGQRNRAAFERKFKGRVPKVYPANFAIPEQRGLMPSEESYAAWTRGFLIAPSEVVTRPSVRRRAKRSLLTVRRKLKRAWARWLRG